MLQKGTPPRKAAEVILKGIQKNKGRIFISDGRVQDFVARLVPTHFVVLVKWMLKLRKVELD